MDPQWQNVGVIAAQGQKKTTQRTVTLDHWEVTAGSTGICSPPPLNMAEHRTGTEHILEDR